MRDWPVYSRHPVNAKSEKENKQISPPKKFYLAEHLIKRKVLPNNYVRVTALSIWSVALPKAV